MGLTFDRIKDISHMSPLSVTAPVAFRLGRWLCRALGLVMLLGCILLPVWVGAAPCPACGTDLPSSLKFCGMCGAPIARGQPPAAAPSAPRLAPVSPQKPGSSFPAAPARGQSPTVPAPPSTWPPARPSATGQPAPPGQPAAPSPLAPTGKEVAPEQFRRLIEPLEAHEPALCLSQLHLPQVRTLIQHTLQPGLAKLQQGVAARGWRLTPAQARVLSLYRERYAAILEWSGTLGSERNVLFARVGQLAALQAGLLAVCNDDALAAIEAITDVYARELQNLIARTDRLEEKAGFENPGVAYQIRRPDLPPGTDAFPFSFWIEPAGRRIGDRMQVTDFEGRLLGRLQFVAEKEGRRHYTGTMSRRAFAALSSRQVWVEYVTRTTFSTSWKKERLRLFLLPGLPAGSEAGYEYEALHGTAPEAVRLRFLQSLGRS